MDLARWTNVEQARADYLTDCAQTQAGPLEAFFEISARCNLRCRMCAINFDGRYRPGTGRPPLFEPELFERLEPAFATLLRVSLFGLGEPLLNRHLTNYVRRLAAAGVEVEFTTNATLIDDAKANELACAGLERVTVSIDGASATVYEGIRVGASFADVLRGIRALAAARERIGRPRRLSLSFVGMTANFADLPQLVDLAAELRVDAVHVEPLFWQPQPDLQAHYREQNLGRLPPGQVEAVLAESRRRARGTGVQLGSRFFEARGSYDYIEHARSLPIDWKCSEPWSAIWVTTAGEVRTCCINERSFGNLFESSFEEIWNGPDFVSFRGQHARREIAAGCANCHRNGRVRQSALFAPVQPTTYRPRLPRPAPGPDPVCLDTPGPGATLTDPLIVGGRIEDDRAAAWEVMIDDTPAGRIGRRSADGSFVLTGPVPYLSEGSHLLWLRRCDDASGTGYAWREFRFWRPAAVDQAILATRFHALLAHRAWPVFRARASIDGQPWPIARLHRAGLGTLVAVLDLGALEPGVHQVQLHCGGRRVAGQWLERLPRA